MKAQLTLSGFSFESTSETLDGVTTGGSALFDPTHTYRWHLSRELGPSPRRVCFVMLNPSEAAAERNDSTLHRCMHFGRLLRFGGLDVVNEFGLVATDPAELEAHPDPVGPENDFHLVRVARAAQLVICGWGAGGSLRGRDREVCRLLHAYPVGTQAPHRRGAVRFGRMPVLWRHKCHSSRALPARNASSFVATLRGTIVATIPFRKAVATMTRKDAISKLEAAAKSDYCGGYTPEGTTRDAAYKCWGAVAVPTRLAKKLIADGIAVAANMLAPPNLTPIRLASIDVASFDAHFAGATWRRDAASGHNVRVGS